MVRITHHKIEITVILYNIRSLHNVGSIFRTADAAGVSKIYLAGFTPAPVDRLGNLREQFAKVSLGAEKFLRWDDSSRSPQATLKLFEKLQKDGYKVFAVEQAKNAIPYYKALPFGVAQGENKSKLALVFGNEVRGLPPSILSRADRVLEIPMAGKKESLNVAVAAGIVLFGLKY